MKLVLVHAMTCHVLGPYGLESQYHIFSLEIHFPLKHTLHPCMSFLMDESGSFTFSTYSSAFAVFKKFFLG